MSTAGVVNLQVNVDRPDGVTTWSLAAPKGTVIGELVRRLIATKVIHHGELFRVNVLGVGTPADDYEMKQSDSVLVMVYKSKVISTRAGTGGAESRTAKACRQAPVGMLLLVAFLLVLALVCKRIGAWEWIDAIVETTVLYVAEGVWRH